MEPAEGTPPPPWRVLLLLSALMVLMHLFDGLAILTLMRHGGEEANPVTAAVIRVCGDWFVAWKAFVAICLAAILSCGSRRSRILWIVFVAGAILYGLITLLNAYLLFCVQPP